MRFAWPAMLWSLALLPLLVATYLHLLSRRSEAARRDALLGVVADAMGATSMRRHLPPLLMLAAVAALLLSAARPSAVLPLPLHHETVILAIDVSHSMRADDVPPSRLAAAQEAAKAFVSGQRSGTRIGLVAFSGDATLVQAPTSDREALERAIDGLQTQDATAIGSAIVASLQALFPAAELDPDWVRPRDTLFTPVAVPVPVEPGSLRSAAVVLLSDGQNTAGPDARDAAELAALRGVRVYTVGFGTPDGTLVGGPGWSVHVHLDEALLRTIAAQTRAEYFHAETASQLKNVYANLTSSLVLERRWTEVSALLCALAAFAAALAAALSLVSFRRVA
jgi:Ca-activated chloride channel family protein